MKITLEFSNAERFMKEEEEEIMMQETTMHEDKQEICNKLCGLLISTFVGQGIRAIGYDPDREEVKTLHHGGDIQRFNVEGDSGIPMINDVLKHIVF